MPYAFALSLFVFFCRDSHYRRETILEMFDTIIGDRAGEVTAVERYRRDEIFDVDEASSMGRFAARYVESARCPSPVVTWQATLVLHCSPTKS